MSLTPVERAESLLSEAVMLLYAVFRDNDFPEHYVRSLARSKVRERLRELRTSEEPVYPLHPMPVALPAEPSVSDSSEGYLRLIALADSRVAEAAEALWQRGSASEDDVISAVESHMAAFLRRVRAQESPAERAALVAKVNQMRASVGIEPADWKEVVTALPVPPPSSR